jgi:HD-like signal output (HDOD) protein
MKQSLPATVRRVSGLSTIPAISMRVMEVTSDPKSSAKELESVINADPSLTSIILKMANSAYFGLREPVLDTRRAVIFLGFKTVRDLALGASVCEIFRSGEEIGNYTRMGLWKHCIGVAVISKMIARRRPDGKYDDSLFSIGILHDIGIILIDQYLHEHFCAVLNHEDFGKKSLTSLEKAIIGFTHDDFAREVASKWKMPPVVYEVISSCHTPSRSTRHTSLAAILYLADVLCKTQEIGFVSSKTVDSIQFNHCLKTLDFTAEDIQVLLEDMPAEMEKAKVFFELAGN